MNVTRLPRAAETLRSQVDALRPRSKSEAHGSPDGYRVIRSVVFSKAAAKWLLELLEIIDDKRIVGLEPQSDGRLIVTFAPTVDADDPTPFPLESVDSILRG